jgi:uncharacterized protein (DUF934 family)
MQLIAPEATAPAGALQLANTDNVLALAAEVGNTTVVVLNFPKWTDGRAYSQAVLLRGRLRYAGQIRASGDVVVDMLPLLRRCGFDAVQLRADQNLESAARTLDILPAPFPGHYQGDATGARPLFDRQPA